ncbi:hypothetical protein ACHAXN_009100 [Cyclotella atomus]
MSLANHYLTSLSTIFTIAFISYYVQYPSLSSQSGIEPCTRVFRHVYPNLFETLIEKGCVDVDSFVELICLVGIGISTVVASGLVQHGLLFITISAMYRLLYTLGGSFYTFQWDILLLEAGYLTALCFAPWKSLRLDRNKQSEGTDNLGVWSLRFLLFKLMLMSGVVKIQAECPTWQNLTALEYHFATQCLPGPLAWHAHQLHPFLLRLGVAATFVIEIPAAYLLICPIASIRKVGAWLQILLQVLIIATGNYNFFNLFTIALCMPCMMGERDDISAGTRRTLQAAAVSFLGYWSFHMFELYQDYHPIDKEKRIFGLKLTLSKDDCNLMIEKTVTASVAVVLLALLSDAIQLILREPLIHRRLSALAKLTVCSFCVIATATPLYSITLSMQQPDVFRRLLQAIPHKNFIQSSGYGLFRRMTGVGRVTKLPNAQSFGWANNSPSLVSRPEIIVEAVIVDNDDSSPDEQNTEWRELKFRWKPGATTSWPRQVAPHQPRFDWRMWFAALGSYHHNPWLISFLDRSLDGCQVVLGLLDEPALASGKSRIIKVRALLYEYDFTRLDTQWARGIPGAKILQEQSLWSFPDEVWTRKLAREYIPSIEKNNPSVRQYLQQTGLDSSACRGHKDRCVHVPTKAKPFCNFAVTVRRWNRPCVLATLVLALCLMYKWMTNSCSRGMKRKVKVD